jgi:hypothetical protein
METAVGGPGVAAGVMGPTSAEGTPVPTPLVLLTVKQYDDPLVSPLTAAVHAPVQGELTALTSTGLVQVAGDDTAYTWTEAPVMAEPLGLPAVHATAALPSPRTAETPVGAEGTPAGVTVSEAALGALAPWTFSATTVKVYAQPLPSPPTEAAGLGPAVPTECGVGSQLDAEVTV